MNRQSGKIDEVKKHSLEKIILVNELHAPVRRNFKRRHVVVKGYDDLWQADIVEMRPYARANKGYKLYNDRHRCIEQVRVGRLAKDQRWKRSNRGVFQDI